jgi:hypothetical protein
VAIRTPEAAAWCILHAGTARMSHGGVEGTHTRSLGGSLEAGMSLLATLGKCKEEKATLRREDGARYEVIHSFIHSWYPWMKRPPLQQDFVPHVSHVAIMLYHLFLCIVPAVHEQVVAV